MANFGNPTQYVAPEREERENPFVEQLSALGLAVDKVIPVTFATGDYKSEKLQIQAAARKLGFSAREIKTTWTEDTTAKTVDSEFRIRPRRKDRGSGQDAVEPQNAE